MSSPKLLAAIERQLFGYYTAEISPLTSVRDPPLSEPLQTGSRITLAF
ncbi:MAG: hypothetical protein SU899_04000 [Chloroflexota bacterium]|nr:hypothetical protein [Chloroflexota bacterium]